MQESVICNCKYEINVCECGHAIIEGRLDTCFNHVIFFYFQKNFVIFLSKLLLDPGVHHSKYSQY